EVFGRDELCAGYAPIQEPNRADWRIPAFMRTTIDIPDKLFKKTKLKAVHEGVLLKALVTRASEREVGERVKRVEKDTKMEDALAPQVRFLAMNRSQRAEAFREESKAMARFYAAHPEEVLPDFYDEPDYESKER